MPLPFTRKLKSKIPHFFKAKSQCLLPFTRKSQSISHNSSSPISNALPIHSLSSLICLPFFVLHPSHADPSNEEDLKRCSTSGTMNFGNNTTRTRPPHHFIRRLSTHTKVYQPLSLPFLKHEFPLDLWSCAFDFWETFWGFFVCLSFLPYPWCSCENSNLFFLVWDLLSKVGQFV